MILSLRRSCCLSSRHRIVCRTFATELPYHLVVGLPALSPTMEFGSLAEWYKEPGDAFTAGDALAKIETDKATIDFEAQDDGHVAKLLVAAGGGDIPVGAPILITVEEAEDVAAFENYELPEPSAAVAAPEAEAATTTATKEETPPATEAPASAPPPPPPPALVQPPVAPVVPPPAAPATAAAATITAHVAWGLSVNKASPLAKTLAAQQQDYIALYGSTGQRPIL